MSEGFARTCASFRSLIGIPIVLVSLPILIGGLNRKSEQAKPVAMAGVEEAWEVGWCDGA